MSVALRLEDEIDISRGDMLVHPDRAPQMVQRFQAMLVWMSERPLDLDKSYLIKHTTQYTQVQLESVDHVVDLETLAASPATHLELNDIGQVSVFSHRPLYWIAIGIAVGPAASSSSTP